MEPEISLRELTKKTFWEKEGEWKSSEHEDKLFPALYPALNL